MPVSAKNSYRTEKTSTVGTSSGPDHLAAMNNAKTEQDKIAAMFAAEGDQWKKQQQEMAQ
jgi:protein MPE1